MEVKLIIIGIVLLVGVLCGINIIKNLVKVAVISLILVFISIFCYYTLGKPTINTTKIEKNITTVIDNTKKTADSIADITKRVVKIK